MFYKYLILLSFILSSSLVWATSQEGLLPETSSELSPIPSSLVLGDRVIELDRNGGIPYPERGEEEKSYEEPGARYVPRGIRVSYGKIPRGNAQINQKTQILAASCPPDCETKSESANMKGESMQAQYQRAVEEFTIWQSTQTKSSRDNGQDSDTSSTESESDEEDTAAEIKRPGTPSPYSASASRTSTAQSPAPLQRTQSLAQLNGCSEGETPGFKIPFPRLQLPTPTPVKKLPENLRTRLTPQQSRFEVSENLETHPGDSDYQGVRWWM